MRVSLVTSTELEGTGDDLDRPYLLDAFAAEGVDVSFDAWEDPSVDWDDRALIVVRSTWNYVERESEFRHFLDRLRDRPNVCNPVEVIEWNLHKGYLDDLALRDVPVVPTRFVDAPDQIAPAIASIDGEVVVKPAVSAGSRLTGRFAPGDPAASELAAAILDDRREVMVQPYLGRLDLDGEYAVIVIDGVVSHRCRKAQILEAGGNFVGGEYRELITPADPDPDLDPAAAAAADACRAIARERGWIGPADELLYARYDLTVDDDGAAVLLEAELFEPALFLPAGPDGAVALAKAVARRIRRTDPHDL